MTIRMADRINYAERLIVGVRDTIKKEDAKLIEEFKEFFPDGGTSATWLDSALLCGVVEKDLLPYIDALESALEKSVVALDDWTNTYANTFCNEKRVKEAQDRLNERGTLWYIAQVQKQNREVIGDKS